MPLFRKPRVTGHHLSWFNRKIERSNCCCLYCGTPFHPDGSPESDLEHLIGRNFVPQGTLSDAFNFTFRACVTCNKKKATAEGHVSAVTLVNSSARADSSINELAERKGRSEFRSRKHSRSVGTSWEEITLGGNLYGAKLALTFQSPPQLIDEDVYELALCHIQGFFTLLTTSDYVEPTQVRLLPENQFYLHGYYPEGDWGNNHLIELARRSIDWECHANIVSASGFFKAIVKVSDSGEWFWALEWNKHLRVVGGIGAQPMSIFANLPDHAWMPSPNGRMRREIPLSVVDELFHGEVTDVGEFARG